MLNKLEEVAALRYGNSRPPLNLMMRRELMVRCGIIIGVQQMAETIKSLVHSNHDPGTDR